ncbi:MAG: hypothetical protein FJ381_15600, partial [Verrucomicrobia bacterium]|nr:hypothetical protein [Verrucomicrobiota bacterium]
MFGLERLLARSPLLALLAILLGLAGCRSAPAPKAVVPVVQPLPSQPVPAPPLTQGVMLGIDVLEAEGFASVKGKRLGLLTHPAGVNRLGVPTV